MINSNISFYFLKLIYLIDEIRLSVFHERGLNLAIMTILDFPHVELVILVNSKVSWLSQAYGMLVNSINLEIANGKRNQISFTI